MSKEDWLNAYERNLADGMSEPQAVAHADERAASIAAQRIDAARAYWSELTAGTDPLAPFRSLDAFTKAFGPRGKR